MRSKSFEIKIHYDQNFNFYVERIPVGKKSLPAFISMSMSEKETLADTYPDKGEIIMTAQPGSRLAKEVVEPLIEEYNRDCRSSSVTRAYKISKGYKFVLIDSLQMSTYGLQHPQYDGSDDTDEIINFIKGLEKELKRESYGVFKCPVCHKIQYQSVVKKRVSCSCGQQFDSEICDSIFTSENNEAPRTAAVNRVIQLQKKDSALEPREDVPDFAGLYPFTYQGVVYRISLPECKSLHRVLYSNFACELVFEIKGDGNIGFTDSYLKYLKSLSDNNIREDLYRAVRKVQNEINAQANSIKSVERAFYWYINNYDLNEDQSLVWRVDAKIYKFKTIEKYVQSFIAAGIEEKSQLMRLFNDLTCGENNLFYGYNSNDVSEISRLIYDVSNQFIYVSGDTIVDFGTDFIEQLHLVDTLVPARNIFLESIIRNYKFWDKIKNAFDVSDLGYKSNDETYYDRLCFYQFAITGKRVLRYKNLSIKNSQTGFSAIKAIIRDAYLIGDESSIKQFRVLVELVNNQNLCERLEKLPPVTETITFNSDRSQESITFETLRQKLVLSTKEIPSIELYLICSDLTGDEHKKIRVRFDGRMNTFSGHLRHILESEQGKSLIDAFKRFYNDTDISFFIKFVINRKSAGGIDTFNSEHGEGFNKLISTIAELSSRYSKLRNEALNAEMRGRSTPRNNEVPRTQRRVEPSGYNSGSPQPQNTERRKSGTTPQSKPTTNQGDNDDEWS